jgi:hypothetical protein
MRYERGLRYARQRVTAVRVGRCACGRRARVFVEANAGTAGWRRLVAVCASCAGGRAVLSFGWLSRMLSDVPVTPDGSAAATPGTGAEGEAAGVPATAATSEGTSAGETGPAPDPTPDRGDGAPELSAVPVEALVPLLTAEVTLLQARLDEVQRQLARLTPE